LKNLHTSLLDEIGDARILRCSIGINWTIVECEYGCGLAQTPVKTMPGCQPLAFAGLITGEELGTIASHIHSQNPLEISLAVAAINAYLNGSDIHTEDINGLDIFSGLEKKVAVVGRFPGLKDRGFKPLIIELNPKEGEYPAEKSEEVINQCDYVVITSSAIVNHTIDNLLKFAENKKVALVGPGTPITPALFDHGINVLSGMIVTDPDLAFRVVGEGGAVQALKKAAKYGTLKRM